MHILQEKKLNSKLLICTLDKQVYKIHLKNLMSHLMTMGKSCFLKRRYLWTSFRSQRYAAYTLLYCDIIRMPIVADTKMFSEKNTMSRAVFNFVETKCKDVGYWFLFQIIWRILHEASEHWRISSHTINRFYSPMAPLLGKCKYESKYINMYRITKYARSSPIF